MSTMREDSAKQWNGRGNIDSINAGSLQRIADATEAMAKNHISLMSERDSYKRLYNSALESLERERRRSSALRGIITKLKKQARGTDASPSGEEPR